MDCPTQTDLADLVEGLLPDEARGAIEAHLDGCATCLRFVAELARQDTEDAAAELRRGAAVGRYVILGRVGEGAMGVVYAAYDPELDRKVALKLLHDGSDADPSRLVKEAQAMAKLSHPNVLTVHDAGTAGGRVFIAMEYVGGPSLTQWLRQQRRPWRDVLDVFVLGGRGLAAAHAAGIVHRDFKPDNVLIGGDGAVRVTDFGLAHVGVADGAPVRVGTPGYMAPEQARGQPADARADQFSFCVALQEALSGDRGAAAPASVRAVLRRGSSERPEDRFPSMELLLAQLVRRAHAFPRRAAAAAALATALLAGALVYGWRAHRARACGAEAATAQAVWDGPAKGRVRAAFLAAGGANASATWDRVQSLLDGYVADWARLRTDVCLAGERDSAFLHAEAACADERLAEVRALTLLFSRADRSMVDKAVDATERLPSVRACAVDAAARVSQPPPADARASALRERLSQARASLHTGEFMAGLASAQEAVAQAQAIGYPRWEGEAYLLLGGLRSDTGDFPGAHEAYAQAVAAADAARDDETRVVALTEQITLSASRLVRMDDVPVLARTASAVLERMGGNPGLEGRLLAAQAISLKRFDDRAAATEMAKRAVALMETAFGPDNLDLAKALGILSEDLARQHQWSEAIDAQVRALHIRQAKLGPRHPYVSQDLLQLERVLLKVGRSEDARAYGEQALELVQAADGADGAFVASCLGLLGEALLELGRVDEGHARLAQALDALEGHADADAQMRIGFVGSELDRGKHFAEAAEWYGRSAEAWEKAHGPKDPGLIYLLKGLGGAQEKLGREREAVSTLQRALELGPPAKGHEVVVGQVRFALARALWSTGQQRDALVQAREAKRAFQLEASYDGLLQEVDSWLEARGVEKSTSPDATKIAGARLPGEHGQNRRDP